MTLQEKEKEGVIIAPAQRDLRVLDAQLVEWLEARMPGVQDLALSNFGYPKGAGQSHETILFDASWKQDGQAHEQGFVVRIKPTGFKVYVDDMFVEQVELMRVMRDSGRVPVAKIFWYESDPALLGAPFFVMEKISGRVAVTVPSYLSEGWVAEATLEQRAKLWDNGVRTLAAIPSIPLEQIAFLDRPTEGDGFMQEWNRWRRYLGVVEERGALPLHRDLLNRLAATMPAHRPQGLVWGDARLGNLMIGEDMEVLAVMDWEQPSLGGALHDLGWWLFNDRVRTSDNNGQGLSGFGTRAQTLQLWSEVSGIATDDIDWYEAFAGLKMCCLYFHMSDMRGQPRPNLAQITPGRHADLVLTEWERKALKGR